MKKLIVAVAAAASFAAFAQDDDFDFLGGGDDAAETESAGDEEEAGEADETEGDDGVAVKKPAAPEKLFYLLPLCKHVEGGVCEVRIPTSAEWREIEEGKFYPLGSSFRTAPGAKMKIQLGNKAEVVMDGDSEFSTVMQTLEVKTRTVNIKRGSINVNLPRNIPDGMMFVSAPGFTVFDASGESRYEYETTGDGDKCFVKCLTGNLSVRGRHFEVLKLRAAQGFIIRTSSDLLFTGLFGKAGDLDVKLDTGLWETIDLDTHEKKSEQRFADWKLSPKTAVRIHRAVPAIGDNLAVTIMTFDSNGDRRDRYWFAENHFETTGSEHAKVENDNSEEDAKRAADASDTVAVEADVDEEEESDSSGASGSGDDDSGSGGSAAAFDDTDLDF